MTRGPGRFDSVFRSEEISAGGSIPVVMTGGFKSMLMTEGALSGVFECMRITRGSYQADLNSLLGWAASMLAHSTAYIILLMIIIIIRRFPAHNELGTCWTSLASPEQPHTSYMTLWKVISSPCGLTPADVGMAFGIQRGDCAVIENTP